MTDGTPTQGDAVAPTAHQKDSGLLATAAWSTPSHATPPKRPESPIHMEEVVRPVLAPREPARFASPSTTVLPAPAPAPDAPSAVSPAATWAEFEPTSRPALNDTSFYRTVPVPDAKAGRTRRSENDLFSRKVRRSPKPLVIAMIAVVLAAGAAGGVLLTRRDHSSPAAPTAPTEAKVKAFSAAATGTTVQPIDIPAAATTGAPYSLALPPGWSATGMLTGPASQHVDLTLTRAASGIDATITSTRATSAADPKASIPTKATAITTFTTTFAGEPARGARWTVDGVRHEDFTLVHNGTAYTLVAHAPVNSASQLTADLKTLRRSWNFSS